MNNAQALSPAATPSLILLPPLRVAGHEAAVQVDLTATPAQALVPLAIYAGLEDASATQLTQQMKRAKVTSLQALFGELCSKGWLAYRHSAKGRREVLRGAHAFLERHDVPTLAKLLEREEATGSPRKGGFFSLVRSIRSEAKGALRAKTAR
jgi:hypothetical protein